MKHFFQSIKFRLTIYYLSVFFCILVVFSVSLLAIYRNYLVQKAKNSLRDKSFVAGAWIDFSNPDFNKQAIDYIHSQESSLTLLLYDRKGNLLGKSASVSKDFSIPVSVMDKINQEDGPQIYESDDRNSIVAVNNLFDNDKRRGFVQLIHHKNEIFDSFNYLVKLVLLSIGVALVVGFVVGLFIVNQMLRPIQKIVDTVNGIQEEKLVASRLPVYNPYDELGKLSSTINSLLARIENSIKNQKKFISDAAHELRTPLAILKGNTEVALMKERESEVLQKNLNEINHLVALTNDLLMIARFDSQSVKPDWKECNLSVLVREVMNNFEFTFQSAGLNCKSDIDNDCYIKCDPSLMKRVLYNLIDNSIKYRGNGNLVSVFLKKDVSGIVKFKLQDNGIGIPADHLPLLFDRFFRVNEDRNKNVEGTGLGLAIVKSILSLHGFSIQIESEYHKGTTVILTF